LFIDVPREVPTGKTIIAFTPAADAASSLGTDTVVLSEKEKAKDIEIINNNAEWLNSEALDVLSFQRLDL
jgi:hypothetical protein